VVARRRDHGQASAKGGFEISKRQLPAFGLASFLSSA
jgi:hypothetical protein